MTRPVESRQLVAGAGRYPLVSRDDMTQPIISLHECAKK